MKKILCAGILLVCILPFYVFSQNPLTISPTPQQITILPSSVASAINCCVLPFSKIFIGRLTEVVWNNQSESDIKLTIGKGPDCKEISGENQAQLMVESILNCQVIQNLPQGKTISMRFADPGQYDYTIEYLGSIVRKQETGSIIVF